MTIDFCVALNGQNVDVLTHILFKSLSDHCNTKDLNFHIVDNGITEPRENLKKIPKDALWHTIDPKWKPSRPLEEYYSESILTPWDVAGWMVNNCGTSKWCMLSHIDLVFNGDVLSWFRNRMADRVGIVGTHCPIMLVNREAYKEQGVNFNCGDNCDVGILLERDLASKGWIHHKFDMVVNKLLYHLGSGSSHHNKDEYTSIRNRTNNIIEGVDFRCYTHKEREMGLPGYNSTQTTVHLTYELSGKWLTACSDGTEYRVSGVVQNHANGSMVSGDPRAVNCLACKKTEIFNKMMSQLPR